MTQYEEMLRITPEEILREANDINSALIALATERVKRKKLEEAFRALQATVPAETTPENAEDVE